MANPKKREMMAQGEDKGWSQHQRDDVEGEAGVIGTT